MSPLILLAIGMVVVVGGILIFRLHAFLALILGAFLIAALTPPDAVYQHELSSRAVAITLGEEASVVPAPTKGQKIVTGRTIALRKAEGGTALERQGVGRLTVMDDGAYYLGERAGYEPVAGDRIVHHTQEAAAAAVKKQNFAERVAEGFGKTCLGIGILIAMAAIVGKCLLDSGAAERIVLGLRRLFGEKGAPLAFMGGGFTLAIPVFFDTVFYLMMPLGKALHVRTGKNYLLYVLAIVCGGTMAHSLVPPTPGPLFVADALGIDIGIAMLGGLAIGIPCALVGLCWALIANAIWTVPLRPSAEMGDEALQAMAKRDEKDLPGLFVSLLPILLPVLLMAGGTAYNMTMDKWEAAPEWFASWKDAVKLLGNKNFALTIAALLGLLLLAKQSGKSRKELSESVGSALAGGATIILITAAGGAFGHVLRQTGISSTIAEMEVLMQFGLIPLAFLVCLVVRTAQGSATVAMITTVGIVAPIVFATPLDYNPLYVALAIGCGSKPISWMNDSGFWVISRMSGLTEGEMLKSNTIMGCLMAATGLGLCLLGAKYLPMV